jgi:hypothetical protein
MGTKMGDINVVFLCCIEDGHALFYFDFLVIDGDFHASSSLVSIRMASPAMASNRHIS